MCVPCADFGAPPIGGKIKISYHFGKSQLLCLEFVLLLPRISPRWRGAGRVWLAVVLALAVCRNRRTFSDLRVIGARPLFFGRAVPQKIIGFSCGRAAQPGAATTPAVREGHRGGGRRPLPVSIPKRYRPGRACPALPIKAPPLTIWLVNGGAVYFMLESVVLSLFLAGHDAESALAEGEQLVLAGVGGDRGDPAERYSVRVLAVKGL